MTRTILVSVAVLAIPVAVSAQGAVSVNCTPDRLPIGGVAALPSGAREWRCMNLPEPTVPDRPPSSSSSSTSATDNAALVGSILQQSIGALGMFLSMREAEAAEAAALAQQRQAAYRVAVQQQRLVEQSRFRQSQQQTLSQMKGGGGSLQWKTGVGEVITDRARIDQTAMRLKPGIQAFLNEFESGMSFLLSAGKLAAERARPASPATAPLPLTGPVAGRVEQAEGGVIVRRGDREGALVAGASLQAGDRIVTGKTGRVTFKLQDGTRLSLGPNTGLGVEEFIVGAGQPTTITTRLYQGALRWLSDPAAREHIRNGQVKTTTAVVAIRGTDFLLEYSEADGGGTLIVRVDDGRVDVIPADGQLISLAAGQSHVLRALLPRR